MKIILILSFILIIINPLFSQSRLNDSLRKVLDTVSQDDQIYRQQVDEVQNKYGGNSKELKALFTKMRINDSIDFIKVESIINNYGWLGADVLGADGNATLFFVIQHSDLAIQQKYLPMMRSAVKNGNAKASELALLEDRVALREGNKQVYGSQVGWNMKTNEYYVLPLIDPENADKRRAAVGLPSMADYLSNWNLKWNVDEYKKDSLKIDTLYKRNF